jgi:hypothetical protein
MLKGLRISSALRSLWNSIRTLEDFTFLVTYGYSKLHSLHSKKLAEIGSYGGQNMRVEVPKAQGGIMLKTIIDRMNQKARGALTGRYYAYSAHDSTLMAILSTFGFSAYDYNRNLIPSYASCLLVELWRRSSDNTPYVRIFYRRDARHVYDLSRKVSGCTSSGCTLSQFVKRSSVYVPGDVNKVRVMLIA